jgi:hypothetical protein
MPAVFIVPVRSQAVSTVAVYTQEVALLPEAEAHGSPTAVSDAADRRSKSSRPAYLASGANALA